MGFVGSFHEPNAFVIQESSATINPDYEERRYAEFSPHVHAVLRKLNEHVINLDLIIELLGYIDDNLGERMAVLM